MLEELYNDFYASGQYTKSYEEFQTQFEDPEYREKVYKGVYEDGDFTGLFSDFENKFNPQKEEKKETELIQPTSDTDIDQYVSVLSNINVSDEEKQEILNQAESGPTEKIRKIKVGGSILQGGGTFEDEKYTSYVYDEFLNEDQTNHEYAKQSWIDQQTQVKFEKKIKPILEQLETEEKPLFTSTDNYSVLSYETTRKAISQRFDLKYKELEPIITSVSTDLRLLDESLITLDGKLADLERKANKNPESITNLDVETFNRLIEFRKGLANTYNSRLTTLNETIPKANKFAELADLTVRTYSNFQIASNRLGSTALKLGSGLIQVTEYLAGDVFKQIANTDDDGNILPDHLRDEAFFAGDFLNTLDNSAKYLYDEAEKISNLTEKRQTLGNVESTAEFGMFMLDLMSEQAINTAITYSTGGIGLGIIAAGASGNKFTSMDYEIKNGRFNPKTGEFENINISPAEYAIAGLGYGFAEFITEKVSLSNFKFGVNNFKKAFGLGSKYSLKPETFGKYLKGYFKGNLGEGTSELFASVMQNSLDRYALGDKNVSIMDGTNEAFWSGFFMSGLGFRAPALAATAYRAATTRDNYQEINNNTKEIIKRQSQLNEIFQNSDMSDPNTAQAISTIQAEIDGYLKLNFIEKGYAEKRVDELSNKDKRTLLDMESKRNRFQKIIDSINNNKKLSPEQKKSAIAFNIQQIDNMDVRKAEILNNSMFSKDMQKLSKANIKLAAEKGLKIKSFTSKPGQNLTKDVMKYIDESNLEADAKKQLKEKVEKTFKDVDNSVHGFSIGAELGLPMQFQLESNKTSGGARGNASVHSHELSHNSLLYAFVQGNPKAYDLINDFFKFTSNRYKGLNEFVDKKIADGRYKESFDLTTQQGKLSLSEERLAIAIDYIRKYHNESFDKSTKGKLLDSWKKFTKGNVDSDLTEEINNGEDVYNMLTSFASGFEVGEISGLAGKVISEGLTKAPTPSKTTKTKVKKSKGTVGSNKNSMSESKIIDKELVLDTSFEDKIQKLFEQGEFVELQESYKPRIMRILRANYPWIENDSKQKFDAIVEEALGPDRGILQMILGPGKTKYDLSRGVPLSGHIGSIMKKRGMLEYVNREYPEGVIQKNTSQEGTQEAVDKKSYEDVIDLKERNKKEIAQEKPSLRKQLKIETGSDVYSKVKNAVVKTFGTKLPSVKSGKLKKALQKAFRTELKTPIAKSVFNKQKISTV